MIVNLTDKAEQKLRQQLAERGKGVGILLGVKSGGCSGFSYKFEFVDIPIDCFHKHYEGFSLFIEKEAEEYLNGLTIDYVKSGLNEKFEFINPNAAAKCGCGDSFTV
jgi:iron-sulfur cluster assembly protein